MKNKSNVELKREYWSAPDKYYTPAMVDHLVARYGDKPATSGEAVYVAQYHLRYIVYELILEPFRRYISGGDKTNLKKGTLMPTETVSLADHTDTCDEAIGLWEYNYESGDSDRREKGYYWVECPKCHRTIITEATVFEPDEDISEGFEEI